MAQLGKGARVHQEEGHCHRDGNGHREAMEAPAFLEYGNDGRNARTKYDAGAHTRGD